jgi:2,3-dihydro-2,3-dihydroxybenzoate dehydrogenase
MAPVVQRQLNYACIIFEGNAMSNIGFLALPVAMLTDSIRSATSMLIPEFQPAAMPIMERTLDGQIAVVTGAAGGLGSALVRSLVRRNAIVAGCDLNIEKIPNVSSDGGVVYPYRLDMRDPGDIERGIEAITTNHGNVDILIHAAVRHFPSEVGKEARPFIDHSPAQVLETLAVAVTGPTLLTQLVCKKMVERGTGRIVFTGSMHRNGTAGLVMYAAAKAYINALARGLFLELREYDIISSVANPGGMNTGLHWHRHSWMLDPSIVAETIVQQIVLPSNVALLSFDMVPHDPAHPDGF